MQCKQLTSFPIVPNESFTFEYNIIFYSLQNRKNDLDVLQTQ
jgi:hypothetical protein